MAYTRLAMRMIREILRLKYEGRLRNRQIARSCGISHVSVRKYLERAERIGFCRAPGPEEGLPPELTEDAVAEPAADGRMPDRERIHRELKRRGVTLKLLWQEYRRERADGYGYTQYCEHYKRWSGHLSPELRQEHKAGEKLFVDWAGQRMPLAGGAEASLFVAVLGASAYTFAEAFADEKEASWIQGHVHAYAFYGGVPRITVPDNVRTAVSAACRYEPGLNGVYRQMAAHYGTAIIPARPRTPKDKPKVEGGVLIVERRILAPLRDRTFFSVGELNAAIRPLLAAVNAEPFQKLPGSRRSLYEELDRPALQPLPARPYEPCRWKKMRVNIDYHVQLGAHYYSVPYRLVGAEVEVRVGERTVEIFHRGERVAAHVRDDEPRRCTTEAGHRPKAHQKHVEWTPGRLIDWATKLGPNCAKAVERILREKPHPEMGYRSCLGLMRLARQYGVARMERAAEKAFACDACSYRSIKSMLQTGVDLLGTEAPSAPPPRHENIRGGTYYGPEAPHAD